MAGGRARIACALAGLVAASACGRRQVAYHFRAPLVRSVNADLGLHPPPADRDDAGAASWHRRAARLGDHRRGGEAGARPEVFAIPAEPLRAAGADGARLAALLRGQVGRRDETSTHVQFALAALREIGARLDPKVAGVDDGAALRDLADERGALITSGDGAVASRPRLGDLLVFDGVITDRPASLVAVVVSADSRGVVEFVYLARGVVRRGWASRARPHDKRDGDGRVVNTFLRHSDGELPRGAQALAGELLSATISLAALLR